jgi:hypothetical protein
MLTGIFFGDNMTLLKKLQQKKKSGKEGKR